MTEDYREDTYSLDISLAEWFLPRFRKLREIQKESIVVSDEINQAYDKIEYAFSLLAEDHEGVDPFWMDDETQKKFDEGMQMFAKYFQTMWW